MAMYVCSICGVGVSAGDEHRCKPEDIENRRKNCKHEFTFPIENIKICVECGAEVVEDTLL